MSNSERPAGVTIVAILLLLIAFNGLFSILGLPSGEGLLSECVHGASARDLFNALFSYAYVVTAIACAVGLWEMRPWAIPAYAGWSGLLVLGLAIKDSGLKLQGETDAGWWAIFVVPIGLAVALTVVGMFLKRELSFGTQYPAG